MILLLFVNSCICKRQNNHHTDYINIYDTTGYIIYYNRLYYLLQQICDYMIQYDTIKTNVRSLESPKMNFLGLEVYICSCPFPYLPIVQSSLFCSASWAWQTSKHKVIEKLIWMVKHGYCKDLHFSTNLVLALLNNLTSIL